VKKARKEGPLTPREFEVLKLVALGLPDKEIAQRLGTRPKTIDTHKLNAMGKLGLPSRVLVTHWAIYHGHVQAFDPHKEQGA
jgi:two-component system capsular synthesis response regulator RcsB